MHGAITQVPVAQWCGPACCCIVLSGVECVRAEWQGLGMPEHMMKDTLTEWSGAGGRAGGSEGWISRSTRPLAKGGPGALVVWVIPS